MDIKELRECDVLALSALITKKFDESSDSVTLSFLADFFTSLGGNLQLVSGQRQRIEAAKNAATAGEPQSPL